MSDSNPTSSDPSVSTGASDSPTASPYSPASSGGGPPRRSGVGMSLLWNFVVPCLILAGAFGIFVWFGESSAEERPPADQSLAGRMQRLPTADVQQVRGLAEIGNQLNLEVDGVVVPFREVQIATEVAGRVVSKSPACEAGNYVTEGQLLCQIDPQDYELEVDRLVQAVSQAKQTIEELEQEKTNSQRLVEIAESDIALRTREVNRLESLRAGFSSESERDFAQQALLQSRQVMTTAKNQLELLTKRRAGLEASLAIAEVQLRVARLNLERTQIRAKVSGVIVREDAELNSFVQRGSTILTIEDTSKAEVAVNLRMDHLFWVLNQDRGNQVNSEDALGLPDQHGYRLPQTAATIEYEVTGRDDSVYKWSGQLMRYDGIGLDQQTRTAPVRIVVDNPRRFEKPDGSESLASGPTALLRGMFVKVVLHIKPQRELVLLPALAMQPGSRIWQFTPDPSVLDVKKEPAGTEAKSADAAGTADEGSEPAEALAADPKDGEEEAEKAAPFVTEDWVAGRVLVIDRVRAIESTKLQLGNLGDGKAEVGVAGESSATKFWICEVAGGALKAGDYVVTSPLTAVSLDTPLSVRVPRAQTEPSQLPVASLP